MRRYRRSCAASRVCEKSLRSQTPKKGAEVSSRIAVRLKMPVLAALVVAACSRASSVSFEFYAEAPDAVESVHAKLCGKTIELKQSGGHFVGESTITCDDVATLEVRLSQGSLECELGYVTHGFTMTTFRATMSRDKCSVVVSNR
jgi:hypothetical protein